MKNKILLLSLVFLIVSSINVFGEKNILGYNIDCSDNRYMWCDDFTTDRGYSGGAYTVANSYLKFDTLNNVVRLNNTYNFSGPSGFCFEFFGNQSIGAGGFTHAGCLSTDNICSANIEFMGYFQGTWYVAGTDANVGAIVDKTNFSMIYCINTTKAPYLNMTYWKINGTGSSPTGYKTHTRALTYNNTPVYFSIVRNSNHAGDIIYLNYILVWNGSVNDAPYLFTSAINFSVTAQNSFNSGSINNFNVSFVSSNNIKNFGTTTGSITTTLLTNDSSVYNITFFSGGFFNHTYRDFNLSIASLVGVLNQSVINFSVRNFITNTSEYGNFTLKLNSTTTCNTSATNNTWCFGNPLNESYNVQVVPNNPSDFHGSNTTVNFSALDNYTVYLYVHDHVINVTAKNFLNGLNIMNFTVNISSLNRTDLRQYSTTDGNLSIPVIHDTYNLTITSNGFALFNNSVLKTIVADANHTFWLYTGNSFNIEFRDSVNFSLINQLVRLELLSDVYSENYSTVNGTLYIDLLTPSIYTLRFDSPTDYPERFYIIALLNNTFNPITLYLINTSVADVDTITVSVVDSNNDPYLDSYIEVLRYDVNNNSYLLQEILSVDNEGKGYFTGELNTEFYKFIVEKPFGTQVYISEPQYLRSTTITLRVTTESLYASTFFSLLGVNANLTFNNNTNNFRLEYNDALNNMGGACLYVYRTENSVSNLYNSSCGITSSGTILINVANASGLSYTAKAYAVIDSIEYFITDYTVDFFDFPEPGSKKYRLFLIIIVSIALIMLLITIDKSLAVVGAPIPILLASLSGFIEVNKGVAIGLLLAGIVLAYYINKKG